MASIVSAGTTSATALNMSADTSGVLQLASNNGVVGLIVDTSQNVTIGTTAGTGRLNVKSTGTYADLILTTNSVTTALFSNESSLAGVVGTVTNHPFLFLINNNEKMRISTAGYVTTPSNPWFLAYC